MLAADPDVGAFADGAASLSFDAIDTAVRTLNFVATLSPSQERVGAVRLHLGAGAVGLQRVELAALNYP